MGGRTYQQVVRARSAGNQGDGRRRHAHSGPLFVEGRPAIFRPDRRQLDLLSPARRLAELGVPVSAATDAVPNDPLFCMWAMIARQDCRSGRVMGPGGVVNHETALRMLHGERRVANLRGRLQGPAIAGLFREISPSCRVIPYVRARRAARYCVHRHDGRWPLGTWRAELICLALHKFQGRR